MYEIMEANKVSKEQATIEFNKWFEAKKLPKTRREGDAEPLVDEMINAIEEGNIVINEDNTITQFLKFPLTTGVDKLNFVFRIQAGTLQQKTAIAKNDQDKLIYKIAALTNEVGGTIRALDSIDHLTASMISAFY